MAARSLNRVQLIGNLTRDPELRYTPAGTAVCSFGLATNRSWTTDTGDRREETEFHRIVSWNKLAELCSQLCSKGRKVYVEGRISMRTYQASDGTQKNITEIVIDDMILLDSRRPEVATAPVGTSKEEAGSDVREKVVSQEVETKEEEPQNEPQKKKSKKKVEDDSASPEVNPEDIPF